MLIKGDCLTEMKKIEDNTVDLLFCDLPWAATSCRWDCALDLPLFWKQVNRVCKINCPMFFCCNAKFGNTLISSNPKNFRYDLVWIKSAPVGFLNAKKMPMKKHELIYVFYRKLPIYDLSSHTHKFLGEKISNRTGKDGVDNKTVWKNRSKSGKETCHSYNPPLPTSIIKEKQIRNTPKLEEGYGKDYLTNKPNYRLINPNLGANGTDSHIYDPPLPTSIIKDDLFIRGKQTNSENKDVYNYNERLKNGTLYHHARKLQKGDEPIYDPPLPTSIIKTDLYSNKNIEGKRELYRNESKQYDPPLPNSILEIKSEKGKHATQKPVQLIEWILKYYSKVGDTVLDPTMGSGSSGVACINMKRKYIGIEKDPDIFKVAKSRVLC